MYIYTHYAHHVPECMSWHSSIYKWGGQLNKTKRQVQYFMIFVLWITTKVILIG